MWVAQHATTCADKRRYLVVATVRRILDRQGNCLEEFDEERVRVRCATCGAKARRFTPSDEYWDAHERELVALSRKDPP